MVRRLVSMSDDPSDPTLTLRLWVIGPIAAILLSFLTQYLNYKFQLVTVPELCIFILLQALGRLMAKLPNVTLRTISVNPGRFSTKEFVLLSVLAFSGADNPYGLAMMAVMKTDYGEELPFLPAFLLSLSMQISGYGIAGIWRRYLVDCPFMFWPSCVAKYAVFWALNEEEALPRSLISPAKALFFACILSCVIAILPAAVPAVTSVSLICLFGKKSIRLQQLGSGKSGFGLLSFSFDWSSASGVLGNPLTIPVVTAYHTILGFLSVMVVGRMAYGANLLGCQRFPFYSFDIFNSKGIAYDTSKNNPEALLSDVNASVIFLLVIGFDFATFGALLTHFFLYHSRNAYRYLVRRFDGVAQYLDGHNRKMERYEKIPSKWFAILSVSATCVSVAICEIYKDKLQLRWWGVLLGTLIPSILVFPITVLLATTGQNITLLPLADAIIGYLFPGKPMASLIFKAFVFSIAFHAQQMLLDLKLGHYLKIPPKHMFISQVSGLVISSLANSIFSSFFLSKVENTCEGGNGPSSCGGNRQAHNYSLLWSAEGLGYLATPLTKICIVMVCIAVALTILIYLLTPKYKWLENVNIPNALAGVNMMPQAGSINYWCWFGAAYLFNVYIYQKAPELWAKFIMPIAEGLDGGSALTTIIASIVAYIRDPSAANKPNPSNGDEMCRYALCPASPAVQLPNCTDAEL